MHAYLKLFKGDEASTIESDARRCVILAIKAVDVINFAELLDMPSVKQLTDKHAQLLKLLNALSQSSCSEFAGQLGEFKTLMKEESLTELDLTTKKSYVQICTLDTQKTNFKF